MEIAVFFHYFLCVIYISASAAVILFAEFTIGLYCCDTVCQK
jgi:hypothetical protein